MQIKMEGDALCGRTFIAAGEYQVSFNTDSQMFVFHRGQKEIKLPGKRRRMTSRSRITSYQWYCSGGPTWSLICVTPKYGEWIVLIEYIDPGAGQDPDGRKGVEGAAEGQRSRDD